MESNSSRDVGDHDLHKRADFPDDDEDKDAWFADAPSASASSVPPKLHQHAGNPSCDDDRDDIHENYIEEFDDFAQLPIEGGISVLTASPSNSASMAQIIIGNSCRVESNRDTKEEVSSTRIENENHRGDDGVDGNENIFSQLDEHRFPQNPSTISTTRSAAKSGNSEAEDYSKSDVKEEEISTHDQKQPTQFHATFHSNDGDKTNIGTEHNYEECGMETDFENDFFEEVELNEVMPERSRNLRPTSSAPSLEAKYDPFDSVNKQFMDEECLESSNPFEEGTGLNGNENAAEVAPATPASYGIHASLSPLLPQSTPKSLAIPHSSNYETTKPLAKNITTNLPISPQRTTTSLSRRRRPFRKMGMISESSPWDDFASSENDCYDDDDKIEGDPEDVAYDASTHSNESSNGNINNNNTNNMDNSGHSIDEEASSTSSALSSSFLSMRRSRHNNNISSDTAEVVSRARSLGSIGGNSSSTGSAGPGGGGSLDRELGMIGPAARRRRRAGRRREDGRSGVSRLAPTAEYGHIHSAVDDREEFIANRSETESETHQTRRRSRTFGRRGSSSVLLSSLDAGMASLRRWIRSHRPGISSSAASASGISEAPPATTNAALQLGEEDLVALSQAGSDSRHALNAESSTTSTSNSYLLDPNTGSSGFLYYRPFEVYIPDDPGADDSGLYTSDDESGTRSILLHPLIPSTADPSENTPESRIPQRRQRAFSEPDRARLVDFFNSLYSSRVIDGGTGRGGGRVSTEVTERQTNEGRSRLSERRRRRRGPRSVGAMISTLNSISDVDNNTDREANALSEMPGIPSTPVIVEEGTEIENAGGFDRDEHELPGDRPRPDSEGVQDTAATTNAIPSNTSPQIPSDTDNGAGVSENLDEDNNEAGDANAIPTSINATEPNRRARSRFLRINRRFQFIISMVAIIFSLLLFAILVCWVLLTSTYVISIDKECDLPLRPYFWLASFQLVLDVFRADIMKWMCRWRSDSRQRIPPRVILYNMGYLVYAMLVLRLGIRSVYRSGDSICSNTAPEFFFATFIFVSLSLAAWATIILGYLVPFCFVAVLLTRNGYFPNAETTSTPGTGVAGGGPRVGMRIGTIVSFPNTYSNPAPPGCVDRLRVVLLDEFPDSFPKECCVSLLMDQF